MAGAFSAAGAMPQLHIWLLCLLAISLASPEINYLHYLTEIQSRFATTDVVGEVQNNENQAVLASFEFEIPPTAFIRAFYLDRNGEVTYGMIKAKEEADFEFDAALAHNKTAARLRLSNAKSFKLDVNLAAKEVLGFNLTYQEVLQKSAFVYKYAAHVKTELSIRDLQMNVLIADSHNFSTLHVPQYAEGLGELPNSELLKREVDSRVSLQTAGDNKGNLAYISFEASDVVNSGDLVLLYNTSTPPGESELQVVNGFFLHQYTPSDDFSRGNKSVIFVLDKSGSMKGRKIEQLKTAMAQILRELHPEDRFNIVLFDAKVQEWKESLVRATPDNIQEAIKFVYSIQAKGNTNIAEALETGVRLLRAAEAVDKSFLATLVFLTDGQATTGKTTKEEILQAIEEEKEVSMQTIAFGSTADYRLLVEIASSHSGFAKRIFENAESDVQIAGFYNELAVPLMKNVKVKYLDGQIDVGSVVTAEESDYIFEGQDHLDIGKTFSESNDLEVNQIVTEIEAGVDEGSIAVKREVAATEVCVEDALLQQVSPNTELRAISICGKDNSLNSFIERMWAHQTLLKYEKILATDAKTEEEKKNVAARIRQLALQYGLVTSQTAMIIVLEGSSRSLRQTDAESEDDGEEVDSSPMSTLQKAEFGPEFRINFDANRINYSDDCSLNAFVFVAESWSRKINRIRARKFGADLVSALPSTADGVPGTVLSNSTLHLEGIGDERELFKIVRDNPTLRHFVVLLIEDVPQRTLQYLDALSLGLRQIVVVSPFKSLSSNSKHLIRSVPRATVLENVRAQSVLQLLSCSA